MTKPLTIYSPAPPTTRLHKLNEIFGELLADGGIPNEVIAIPLPDSINQIADLPIDERVLHLPIITPIDLLPAINKTGPDWHAYNRANKDLLFVANLYDVAFGVTALSDAIKSPDDLRGKRIAVPPRPSSVRLYSEALLFDGWGLAGEVELIDFKPPDLLAAVKAGEIDATTWNITTREPGGNVPALPWVADWPGAHWLPVDMETLDRINSAHPFAVERMLFEDTPLLSFCQGFAVWRETPSEMVAKITELLKGKKDGPLFHRPQDMAQWPGLASNMRHPFDYSKTTG